MKHLTSAKEVKKFVKRASGSQLYQWLENIHKSGFVAGYTAAHRDKTRDETNDTTSMQSTENEITGGESDIDRSFVGVDESGDGQ